MCKKKKKTTPRLCALQIKPFLLIKKRSPTLISSTSILKLKTHYLQGQKESKAGICRNITLLLHSPNGCRPHQSPSPASRYWALAPSWLGVWVGGQGYLQGTRTPFPVMSPKWITNTREKRKREARLQLHGTERRSRYLALVPHPTAGRSAKGPVILPPPRAPPRARDRSGAFRPRAAPPSAHRR